jgi:hypothetical protein
MLRVTRGVVNVGTCFGRLRREVHSGVDNIDSTPAVQIITALDDYCSKHRSCKAIIPFSYMPPICRKNLYDSRLADYYIEKGGDITTFIFAAAEEIVRQFRLAFATCDRAVVHQSVRNRVLIKKTLLSMVSNMYDVTL